MFSQTIRISDILNTYPVKKNKDKNSIPMRQAIVKEPKSVEGSMNFLKAKAVIKRMPPITRLMKIIFRKKK